MKNYTKPLFIGLVSCLMPLFFLSSCDDDDNNNGNGGENTEATDNANEDNANNANSNNSCLEGTTIHYVGTQTQTVEATEPIANTTETELDFDLRVQFLANGINKTTGTVTVTKITNSLAGNITQGVGTTTDVDEEGTYDCSEENTNGSLTSTVTENGITTTYTLTYTSDNAGTFTTTITGTTEEGIEITGSSSGTFTQTAN